MRLELDKSRENPLEHFHTLLINQILFFPLELYFFSRVIEIPLYNVCK